MKNLTRRCFLRRGTSTLLGLAAGCGSGSTLPVSLSGYLLLNEYHDDGTSRIVAMRPDGSNKKFLLDRHYLLSVSPDGQVLEVAQDTGSYPRGLYSLEGKSPVLLTEIQRFRAGVWSPDSQVLLCQTVPLGITNLRRVQRRDGAIQRLLTSNSVTGIFHFGWLNNTELVWADDRGTFRMHQDGSGQEKLSEHVYHTPSPDGRFLLRTWKHGTLTAVERLELATGATELLVDNLDILGQLGWSRDGSSVVLTGSKSGYLTFRVNASTGATETIELPSIAGGPPTVIWSPDTKSYAYRWVRQQGLDGPLPTFLEIRGAVGSLTLPQNYDPIAWL